MPKFLLLPVGLEPATFCLQSRHSIHSATEVLNLVSIYNKMSVNPAKNRLKSIRFDHKLYNFFEYLSHKYFLTFFSFT